MSTRQEEDVGKKVEELEKLYEETISAWANSIDDKTSYTKEHSNKVRRYAEAIGTRLYLSEDEMRTLSVASILHDIGKQDIDPNILNKPGPLTSEEYNLVKTHSAKGASVLRSIDMLKSATGAVHHHHERYDGYGYPSGLKGEEIPYLARILAVADAFDAMTSERPYKPKKSIHEAIIELQDNSGTQFDPEITDAFIHVLRANPGITT
ncbi:MAG: HD-GYP domain-containing protein [bacterium]